MKRTRKSVKNTHKNVKHKFLTKKRKYRKTSNIKNRRKSANLRRNTRRTLRAGQLSPVVTRSVLGDITQKLVNSPVSKRVIKPLSQQLVKPVMKETATDIIGKGLKEGAKVLLEDKENISPTKLPKRIVDNVFNVKGQTVQDKLKSSSPSSLPYMKTITPQSMQQSSFSFRRCLDPC